MIQKQFKILLAIALTEVNKRIIIAVRWKLRKISERIGHAAPSLWTLLRFKYC